MEHKGSSGFHSLLGQTESFNYPQRVCPVAYRVGYSLLYTLGGRMAWERDSHPKLAEGFSCHIVIIDN